MKTDKSVFKRLFSLVQALLLTAGMLPPSLAASDTANTLSYSDLVSLSDCETKLDGAPHPSLPSSRRVASLENEVFGETKKGSLSARVAGLKSTLATNTPSLLNPPLTAKMDTAAKSKTDEAESEELPPLAPPIDHAKSALHQALTLYSQGKVHDAEIGFKRVLALDPNNTDANFNLGAIAEGRGDLSAALNYYKAVLRINPGDSDAQSGINALEQKIAGARGSNFAATTSPESAPNRQALKDNVNQASQAFKRGDYDSSIRILEGVARQAPNEPDIQYALAQSYKGKGEYTLARAALNQAIALAPENQMYKDALRDLNQGTANGGGSGDYSDKIASNTGNGASTEPAGKITPFTGVGSPSTGWQPTSSDTFAGGYGAYYPGYANRYSGGSTTNRIQRAAVSGLAGAAVGALFGGALSGYGNRSRGMMMGAGMGGLFGLMFGAR